MKKLDIAIAGMIAAFGASTAIAQNPPPAEGADPAAAEAAQAEAPAEGQVAITAEDVDNYAKAMTKVTEIQADTSLDDAQKQAAMSAAVQESNLDPAKFNAIAEASQSNPELQQRVQDAMAKHQQGR